MADVQNSSNAGYFVVGAVGVVIVFIAILGQKASPPAQNQMQAFGSSSLGDQLNQIDPVASVEPLDAKALKIGGKHFTMASKAEGLSGAMVYSQNCYDAVAHSFSWQRLDTCGAFDMRAEQMAADMTDTNSQQTEADYFAPEMGERRYLTAVTHAGLSADDADLRLETLQKSAQ